MINPLIAAVFGQPDLSGVLAWTVRPAEGDTPATVLSIGAFLGSALNFVLVALAVYLAVVVPMNRLAERRKSGEEPEPAAPAEDVLLLTEIRDLLKR